MHFLSSSFRRDITFKLSLVLFVGLFPLVHVWDFCYAHEDHTWSVLDPGFINRAPAVPWALSVQFRLVAWMFTETPQSTIKPPVSAANAIFHLDLLYESTPIAVCLVALPFSVAAQRPKDMGCFLSIPVQGVRDGRVCICEFVFWLLHVAFSIIIIM